MSSRIRDTIYLSIVGVQLVGMLVLDLVPFYPPSLWQPPSSPLHALVSLRTWWASYSGDPYFSTTTTTTTTTTGSAPPGNEPWFEAFLYVEALVQLPLTVYLVCALAPWQPSWSSSSSSSSSRARSRGPAELAGLAYGCVTFMGALACCFDLWDKRPGGGRRGGVAVAVAEEHWARLFWGAYMPYCVVPAVMAVDMYWRLLRRVRSTAG
ncbi:hypothetical protein E4U41_005548 [Claviceps citrina]|nr:hypothetical protein E4U41_005548 [Claviceps citrina]